MRGAVVKHPDQVACPANLRHHPKAEGWTAINKQLPTTHRRHTHTPTHPGPRGLCEYQEEAIIWENEEEPPGIIGRQQPHNQPSVLDALRNRNEHFGPPTGQGRTTRIIATYLGRHEPDRTITTTTGRLIATATNIVTLNRTTDSRWLNLPPKTTHHRDRI